MPSAIEISSGANAALFGAAFCVWIATIWLFYNGDWQTHPSEQARKSAAMFIRGVCLVSASHWLYRGYWLAVGATYQPYPEVAGFLRDLFGVAASIKLMGVVGYVLMLYPVLERFPVDWRISAAAVGALLFAFGVWLV